MYLWIIPPDERPGWLHQGIEADDVAAIVAQYPIPADNADRVAAWNERCEGANPPPSVALAQQWRCDAGVWGIGALTYIPPDMPAAVVRIDGVVNPAPPEE